MFTYYTSKKAIAYTRVSTTAQEESGLGLASQRSAIETYARQQGVEIVEWFSDAASARGEQSLKNRPGLQAAIAAAKANEADLLVDRIDRLSRHTETIIKIFGNEKIMVVAVSEGETDNPLVLASRAAKAQFEGDRISELTKKGLTRIKASGVRLGNPTNLNEAQRRGAAANKKRAEEKAQELAGVIGAYGWHDLSMPKLADALNRAGIKTSRDKPWTAAALRRPFERAIEILGYKIAAKATESDFEAYQDDETFGAF
jgi:DNA invertase Pin-like site-specific DNA recombinase